MIYYKTPWKAHLFDVNAEAVPKQVNYLIDESQTIGVDGKKSHGPNTVISLLDHFLKRMGKVKRNVFVMLTTVVGKTKCYCLLCMEGNERLT